MPIRVMSIAGSMRATSRTHAVLELVQSNLEDRGVRNVIWSFHDRPLPMMDPETRGQPSRIDDPFVLGFIELARTSDAFVLGSPVYHDSYSGVLKNALDYLSAAELGGKPFGLVSHGGCRTTQALAHLRIVVRGVNGLATATQICTEDGDLTIDSRDRVVGVRRKDVVQRIDRFSDELVRLASMLRAARADEVPAARAVTLGG